MEAMDPALISARVTAAIGETLDEDGRLLTDNDRVRLVDDVKNELLGLGPLEPLLRDDEISDFIVSIYHGTSPCLSGYLHRRCVKASKPLWQCCCWHFSLVTSE
jgi:Flp pilus assembly CpaF family ATPase